MEKERLWNMEIKLHIHKQGYKHKPHGHAVAVISNEVTTQATTITPAELAQVVGAEGHTAVLATMNGKRSKLNMVQQQVLMVDFDNTEIIKLADGTSKKLKTEGMFYTSIQDILNDSFIQQNASFIYKTLSHTSAWEKFRVVFVLDKPLTSLEEVYGAYDFLLDKYPNADKSCKDPSRLFFGGTENIIINLDNLLTADSLPKAVVEKPKLKVVAQPKTKVERAKEAKPVTPAGGIETWKLMKQGNKEEVAKRLSVYGARVHSKVQAIRLLKSFNMADILGITGSPFNDIFHSEKNPSAGIFKMEDADIYLYKCHSSSHAFTGDIVMVTSKLMGVSYMDALRYLMEVTSIQVEMTEQIRELREQCDIFMDLLLSEDLKENYPAIYGRFNRYKANIVAILTIFKENIYEDEEGNLRSLTWMSVRNLSLRLYGKESRHSTVSQLLNLLAYTNWIEKLDESQIPSELLKKLKTTQENKDKKEKRSNVFELLTLGDDFFTQLNKQCEVMKEVGFTMKGFSKEYVERTDGKEVADGLYVQDKERKISKVSDAITADIHKIALKMLDKEGIIIEKDLLEKVQKRWKSKGFTERKYKQALSEMLDMYDLKRKRLNKDLKEQFGLTKKFTPTQSPTILMKAI